VTWTKFQALIDPNHFQTSSSFPACFVKFTPRSYKSILHFVEPQDELVGDRLQHGFRIEAGAMTRTLNPLDSNEKPAFLLRAK